MLARVDWANPEYTAVYEERVERLRNFRALGPEERLKVRTHYARSPIDWIEDWCFTWDPRQLEGGKSALRPLLLFPRQKEMIRFVHDCNANREDAAIEKSRDTGVSWCFIAYAVWLWLHRPGAVIGFGSYEASKVDVLGVTDSLLEKARVIIRHLPQEFLPAGLDTGPSGHLLHKRLLNPENGAQLIGEIGDNIGRGARASIYFVDEAAHLKHPDLVDGSLASTTDCKIYASTAYGMGAFHSKTQSTQFRQFRFHWTQDPRKDQAWYQRYLAKWGPVITAREVDIDHAASIENLVIEAKWIQASRGLRRALLKAGLSVPPRDRFPDGVSGLDVGGGAAPSVFCARNGPYVSPPKDWKQGDTTGTATRALALARKARTEQLNFDTVGIGAGVASTLRHSKPAERTLDKAPPSTTPVAAAPSKEESVKDAVERAFDSVDTEVAALPGDTPSGMVTAHGINTGEPASARVKWPDGRTSQQWFINLRAELWWTMRVRLQATYETWLHVTGQEDGTLHPFEDLVLLPDHDQLAKELAAPTWFERPGGKIGIESKKDMAARGVKSPDFADALALTYVPRRARARAGKAKGYF